MTGFFNEIDTMMRFIAVVAVVVFLAMMVDLAAGIYKAYLRNDARRSEALKRTGYKFCLYEGTILIAAGVDVCIHIAKLYLWFGWELVYGLPLITLGIGIFWCVVEFLSVREKADEKTHSDISKQPKRTKKAKAVIHAMSLSFLPFITLNCLSGRIPSALLV